MKAKTKIILMFPIVGWRNLRAASLAKKAKKEGSEDKYPVQWRNDLIIKRSRQTLRLINVDLKVIGYDNIPKQPAILAPNHASAIDPLIIMGAMKNPDESVDAQNQRAVFIAKAELKKNRRFRGYANLIDTFYIDRKKPREALTIIDDAVSEVKESKRHLVIFPEGTRSKDGKIQDFKGGAFKVAKKAFLPIVPITINNSFSGTDLSRSEKLKVEIIFHKAIKPLTFMSSDPKGLAVKIQKIVEGAWVAPQAWKHVGKKDIGNSHG